MLLNQVPLNHSPLDSNSEFLVLISQLNSFDNYTDVLTSTEVITDIIVEVSSVAVGSLYVESPSDTATNVDSFTDNLIVLIFDTITEVSSETNAYFPAPGNEVDIIVSVDSQTNVAAFVLTITDSGNIIVDSYTDQLFLVNTDEDVIIETSSYTDAASFIINDLLDIVKLVDSIEDFIGADTLKLVDSFEENTYVSNVNAIPISNLLPEKFIQVPLVADLLSVVNTNLIEVVHSLVDNIRRMRTPTLFEIFYSEKLAGSLGFYQDITSKTEAQKRRLIESLTDFYARNGTIFTFDFLSFIADENIQVVPLYTQNYLTFSSFPGGVLEPEGPWYLTSQVDLEYSSVTQIDNVEITKRFYQIAPVPLMIRNISQLQVLEITEYNRGYCHTEIEILTTSGTPV